MRIVLTSIAAALVVALTAALAAPWFIDWSARRGALEAELTRRLGVSVHIAGAVEARLLPTPYLAMKDVSVGDLADPLLRSEGVRLELALAGLAAGEMRFSEVTLKNPSAHFATGARGEIAAPRARLAALAERIAIERLIVVNGAARVERPGAAPWIISNLDFDASAKSLVGPFRAEGALSTQIGGRTQFQLVSAEAVGDALPLKLELSGGKDRPRAAFDGKLVASNGGDISYIGAATLTGGAASPWNASGNLRLNRAGATLAGLSLRLGPDARALATTGSGVATFGAIPALDLQLQSKQLNFDSWLRKEGETSAPPSRLVRTLADWDAYFSNVRDRPFSMRLRFAAPSAFLGAEALEGLNFEASIQPGAPIKGLFEAGLPGRSRLRFDGSFELGAAPKLMGQLAAEIGDLDALRDWASEGEPEFGERLRRWNRALGYSSASARSDIEASSVGISARNLNLTLGRSNFTGAVAFTKALGEARGRLFVDLNSDSLDLDAAPNLAAADGLADFDASLALEATKLHIARVGDARVDGGSLSLKASKTGDKISLERLFLADLGGATIEAQGEATPAGRWINARLDAARLGEFAALMRRVAPGAPSQWLVVRADALSPARATLEARGDGAANAGAFGLEAVKSEGQAGATKFTFKLAPAPGANDALASELTFDSSDAASLLRQLGVRPAAGVSARARLSATASGRWGSGFDVALNGTLAGTDLGWRGRWRPNPTNEDEASLFGAATLKSDNVMPALALLGVATNGATTQAPVDLQGEIALRGVRLAAPRISGSLAGAKVAGALSWNPSTLSVSDLDPDVAVAQRIAGETPISPGAEISGEISLDRANAAALAALPFGPAAPAKTGARWSEAKFAPPILTPPQSDVRLRIGALDFGAGAPARNFSGRLRTGGGKFELAEMGFELAGGQVSGDVSVRRDGATAALTGKVAADAINIDRAALRGRFGGALEMAGTGESASTLVAGLVGEGRLNISGVAAARLDAGALARVIARAQAPDAPIDATNIAHQFSQELDKQALTLPDGAVAATLASGVARFGPVETTSPGGHILASGEFDLRTFELAVRAVFEQASGGKFWSGAPPQAAATLAGPLDAPVRREDVSSLAAGLAAQAIARESERIAALEADMRERAFFNRRMKAGRYQARRAAEIAAFEAHQAEFQFEAERARVESALLKAYEEERKAAVPTPPDAPPRPPEPAPTPKSSAADPAVNGVY